MRHSLLKALAESKRYDDSFDILPTPDGKGCFIAHTNQFDTQMAAGPFANRKAALRVFEETFAENFPKEIQ
jgi:hypothetical protein